MDITAQTPPQSLGRKILLRMSEMEEIRRPYETGLWEDITKFINPRREDITVGSGSVKGQRYGKDAYDGTPQSAFATWRDGMQGFTCSESIVWFGAEMSVPYLNEIDEVKMWLQEYVIAMYSAFRRSNFYAVLPEWYGDAGSVGTATLYTEEDIERKGETHIVVHPREVFVAENKYGVVDTVFRRFNLTARQAFQKFGDKCSQRIKDDNEKLPNTEHEFIHAVFPNDDYWPNKSNERGKKFRSVYVESKNSPNQGGIMGEPNIVSDKGYKLNPYTCWRYRKNSDEIYGRSPAADAIVETFAINQLGKTMLQVAQKAVEQPLQVPEEMRGNVRMGPKGLTYYQDPKRLAYPLYQRIDYPIAIDQWNRLQRLIEEKYRVEFFLALTKAAGERELKATHVIEMRSEQAVLMGPQVDRLNAEGLNKVFDIVSDIEDRFGNLPEAPPQVLEAAQKGGASINIIFTGPLAQAQRRLFELQPIQDGLNQMALASAIYPEIRFKVRPFETADAILEATNFPEKLTRSNEEAQALHQQELQKQAQAEQMAQLQAGAEAVPKLSKPIEENSMLDKLGV